MRGRKKKQRAFFATCLFVFALPSQAEQNAINIFDLSLEQLLDVNVLGATLTEQEQKLAPSSVTVFSCQQIRELGVDSLGELMNMVAGFQSYRSSTTALDYPFSVRGRRIGTASAEVLILLDGQRLNEARTSGAAISMPMLSVANIEHIEFIRGPGAAIYGSNAMMGVINIVTREHEKELHAGIGSFNRFKGHVKTNYSSANSYFDLYLTADRDSGDQFSILNVDNIQTTSTQDPRRQYELNMKYQRGETLLNLQHFHYEAQDFISYAGPGDGNNDRLSQSTSLALTTPLKWYNVNSKFRLSYNRSSVKVSSQATDAGVLAAISNPSSNDPLVTLSEGEPFSEWRALWSNDLRLNSDHSLQFGLEYRALNMPEFTTRYNYDLNAYRTRDYPITWFNGDFGAERTTQEASSRDIYGAYGQYQRNILPNTHLTLGLRYDHFSQLGEQLSPRMGLVQSLTESQSIKLLYGHAFRAPSEEELNLSVSSRFAGNTSLEPETVKTLELIWLGQWRKTRASIGYFENVFEQAISQSINADGYLQFGNAVEDERSRGFEVELNHEFGLSWRVLATFTRITKTSENSFREADSLGSLGVNYQQNKWNVNLGAHYAGKRDMLVPGGGLQALDSYWYTFGKLQYQLKSDWRLSLQVKNIDDSEYFTPASSDVLANGVPNRGTSVLLGVNWQF